MTRRARRTSFDSETYRGKTRQSEPEVSSLDALIGKVKPKFLLDYHSAAGLILYPEGWQVETESTDSPATKALAGYDDDHPAIANFDPDVSGELYTTNGDVTGSVYNKYGSLAYTVELEAGTGPGVGGTRRERQRVRPGRVRLPGLRDRRRGAVPAQPAVRARPREVGQEPGPPGLAPRQHGGGLRARPRSRSPTARRRPSRSTRTAISARSTSHWQVNGGAEQTAPTTEYKGGERYDPPGVYYHEMRANDHRLQRRRQRARCGSPPAPRRRRRSRSRPRRPRPTAC